jgi:anti-sigma B factor antagonist
VAVGEHLRIELRREQGLALLHLDGELDLASAPLLQTELDSAAVAEAPKLLVDLGELHFIDSTGLRAIFAAQAQARERGQDFAVTKGSEQVQRLLAITRMSEHLRIVSGPEEMLA